MCGGGGSGGSGGGGSSSSSSSSSSSGYSIGFGSGQVDPGLASMNSRVPLLFP